MWVFCYWLIFFCSTSTNAMHSVWVEGEEQQKLCILICFGAIPLDKTTWVNTLLCYTRILCWSCAAAAATTYFIECLLASCLKFGSPCRICTLVITVEKNSAQIEEQQQQHEQLIDTKKQPKNFWEWLIYDDPLELQTLMRHSSHRCTQQTTNEQSHFFLSTKNGKQNTEKYSKNVLRRLKSLWLCVFFFCCGPKIEN